MPGVLEAAGLCAICGSATSPWIEDAVDYITGKQFAVRRCSRCGLAATEPQPSSMDQYYPARYRHYSGATLRMLTLLYRWRARGWMRWLGRRGPQRGTRAEVPRPGSHRGSRAGVPRRGTALEVGCGNGWMLGALRDRGWRVLGSERSINGARAARAVNQVPVFVGDLSSLRPSAFDLIIFFQVLEHLSEPLPALQRSAELLADGGVLIVAVPNFASWQARLFGRSWFHLDVPRHQHHFSPHALRCALEKLGLRVIRTRFVSFEHDPYGWVQSSLNRMGFKQNLLTKSLMGMPQPEASLPTMAAMLAVTALLIVPSIILAMCSWAAGSGAVMEMWAAKA